VHIGSFPSPRLSLLLFCWPFSYATHYAKNTREENKRKTKMWRKKKRKKKRASNKTEEAILSREQTRRERGEQNEGGRRGTVYREGKSDVPAAVVVDIMREE